MKTIKGEIVKITTTDKIQIVIEAKATEANYATVGALRHNSVEIMEELDGDRELVEWERLPEKPEPDYLWSGPRRDKPPVAGSNAVKVAR